MSIFSGFFDCKTDILDKNNLHTNTYKKFGVVEDFEVLFDSNVYSLTIEQSPYSNNFRIKLTRRTSRK